MCFGKFFKFKFGKEFGFDDEVLVEVFEVFEKKVKCQFVMMVFFDEIYIIFVGGLFNNKVFGVFCGCYLFKVSDLIIIFELVIVEVICFVKE